MCIEYYELFLYNVFCLNLEKGGNICLKLCVVLSCFCIHELRCTKMKINFVLTSYFVLSLLLLTKIIMLIALIPPIDIIIVIFNRNYYYYS